MSLIKAMNESISTLEKDPVKEAVRMVENLRPSPKEEMIRIADHWKVEGKALQTDELGELIANDLEQLEYSPEEVNNLTLRVLKMIGRQL